jgi:hypothetical protein
MGAATAGMLRLPATVRVACRPGGGRASNFSVSRAYAYPWLGRSSALDGKSSVQNRKSRLFTCCECLLGD